MSIFSRYSHIFSTRRRPARGFTLVELMVVVAIVLIITTFVLFQHSRFDSSTLLRSLSYAVALTMRQAQVYGTSVRGDTYDGNVIYAPGYGVYFSSSLGCSGGTNTCYVLFADGNGDQAWSIDETVSTSTLGRGFSIKDFCAVSALGVADCGISSLTVYFKRPNPDALFFTSSPGATYSYAYVELQSASATGQRAVKVTATGQIAVCNRDVDVSTC